MLLGSIIITTQKGTVENTLVITAYMRLEIGTFCLVSENLAFWRIKHSHTHTHTNETYDHLL